MRPRHYGFRLLALGVLALLAPTAAAQMGPDFNNARSPLDCDAVVERYNREVLAYGCYLNLARRTRDYATVRLHLEGLVAVNPKDHAARMNLGRLLADLADAAGMQHYEQALAGFLADEHHEGAIYTLYMMSFWAQYFGNLDLAGAHLVQADGVALDSEDDSLLARVKQWRARHAIARHDYAAAYVLAKEGEALAFPGGTLNARVSVLGLLGTISTALGRPDLALDYHRREAEAIGDGTIQWVATIQTNIADLARRVRIPRRYTRDEQIAFARKALDTAVRAGSPQPEARARVILGQLLEGHEALEQYEMARQVAMVVYDRLGVAAALWGKAWETYQADPGELDLALAILQEADQVSRVIGAVQNVARTAILRADLQWLAGRTEAAKADSLVALDHIERFRDLQHDDTVRARAFGAWVDAYARFADRMLAAGDLESALLVGERMRARVLLDRLDAMRFTGNLGSDSPSRDERDGILQRIAGVQRRLLESNLDQETRDALLRELEQLEVEESSLLEAIARDDERFAALRQPSFPTIDSVRQELADDEAVLVFHVGRDPAPETRSWRGDSRILILTREDARSVEIDAGEDLPTRIDAFNELIRKRSWAEQPAAISLYADLIGPALRDLPVSIRRLIVIPDGPVFKLPVGTLRASEDEPPLVARFDLVSAPSVTLWLRWRRADEEPAPHPALVFADPERPGDASAAVHRAAGVFGTPVELGPLPMAREEGRSVIRRLGGESRLLVGAEASETTLKELPLQDYRVLHFAAHAIVDEAYPERSAIVLAPGAETEDGLLQPREIAALDLSGSVVVLSACRSAGGELLPGEGVMGLARAFFQGGAHAVVGSLWPLRDDEAAALVDDLSRRLGQGMSVGRAVAETQRRWIRAGRPPAAWSGLVVLGDGDVVPLPGGGSGSFGWWLVPLAVLIVALGWAAVRSRARKTN